jgi:signal transduction histidine kinase
MRPLAEPRVHSRIFARIFSISLIFFVLIAIAGALVAVFFESHTAWYRMPRFIGRQFGEGSAALLDDPVRLQARLTHLAADSELSATIYRLDGTRLASAGAAPMPPLPPGVAAALSTPQLLRIRFAFGFAMPLQSAAGDRAVLLVGVPAGRHLHRVLGFLAILIVAVMSLSALLAWDISRPLNRLKKQAMAFGAGDLSARTAIRRRDEIGQLAVTFNEMGGQIQTMVRREKELLANISHELRTPLSRIRVAVELCAEEDVGVERIRGLLGGIDGDLAELEALVGDALTTFRLDAAPGGGKQYQLRREPLDFAALLRDAAEKFNAAQANARAAVRGAVGLPSLNADGALLRRVIENLLDNAAKYGDRSAPIEISAALESNAIAVEIADRGGGVPADELPLLFEPFFRSAQADRKGAGLGLGLTLCKRIVEAHGGRIAALPRAGGGLLVRFVLPLS